MDTKLCITGKCNRLLGLKIDPKNLFCEAIATLLQLPKPSTTIKGKSVN